LFKVLVKIAIVIEMNLILLIASPQPYSPYANDDHVNLPFELDAQHSGSNKASQSPERLGRVKVYAGLPYFVDHQ
jgi:hypothetical protein